MTKTWQIENTWTCTSCDTAHSGSVNSGVWEDVEAMTGVSLGPWQETMLEEAEEVFDAWEAGEKSIQQLYTEGVIRHGWPRGLTSTFERALQTIKAR